MFNLNKFEKIRINTNTFNKLLKQQDIKVQELAHVLNINVGVLYDEKAGRITPTFSHLNKYCEFFNTVPETLLGLKMEYKYMILKIYSSPQDFFKNALDIRCSNFTDFADTVGVNYNHIINWYNKRSNLTIQEVAIMADYLSVGMANFLPYNYNTVPSQNEKIFINRYNFRILLDCNNTDIDYILAHTTINKTKLIRTYWTGDSYTVDEAEQLADIFDCTIFDLQERKEVSYKKSIIRSLTDSPENYKRLAFIVADRGWNIKQVSEITNLSPALFSKWKHNKKEPSIPSLQHIAKQLDMEENYLLSEQQLEELEKLKIPCNPETDKVKVKFTDEWHINLKRLMNSKRITPKELAVDINVSLDLIYKWLGNKRHPSKKNLAKLIDYFDITTESFYGASY